MRPFLGLLRWSVIVAALTIVRSAHASDTDWHKLTTPHFVLYTDLDREPAIEAAEELEKTRAALIRAAWPTFSFPDVVRTQVYVLKNGLDFERYFDRYVWGLFVHGAHPSFYLYGPPSRWAPRRALDQPAPSSVLRHEMTHQLAASVFPRTPHWFAEGLAQFLETVQITQDGKSVVVGDTNSDAQGKYYADRTVTLRRTLNWDESIEELPHREVAGLYGKSWAFFHWLYNNRQDAFSEYQLALAKGVSSNKAWKKAFAGFNPEDFDPVIHQYLNDGMAQVNIRALPSSAPSIDIKALSAADAHGVRARIAGVGARTVKEDEREARLKDAVAELNRALKLDPTSVEALVLAPSMESNTLAELARAAAKAHPEDSRIHALLGDVLDDRSEREASYRRSLQIDRDDPKVLESFAKLLIASNRVDDAFPFALRAAIRAPHDHGVLETFAETLFQRGRCQDAIPQQQRAADQARERSSRAKAIGERLKEMKASCKASGKWREERDFDDVASVDAAYDSAGLAPSNHKVRPHYEGIFAAANLGLAYGSGTYESNVLQSSNTSFSGGGVDFQAALGYGVAHGLALALEAGIFAHPAFSEQVNFPGGAFVTDVTTVRLGALADFHPLGALPLHLQGGLALIRGTWGGAPGSPRVGELPIDEISLGYFAHADLGFTWKVHTYEMGPSLRLHFADLGSEHTDASLFGLTGLIGFYL